MSMRPPEVRAEPAGMTLADLLVLVLGSAVALSLPKIGLIAPWPYPNCFGLPRPDPPGWAMRFGTITEFGLKCNLVVALVALGRCWRWDRALRPSEWLAVLTGISLVGLIEREPYGIVIQYLAGFRFGLDDSFIHSDLWILVLLSHDVWSVLLGTLIGLSCLAMIVRFRERLPARVKTILAIGAAYALISGPMARTWGAIYDLIYYFHPDAIRNSIVIGLMRGPRFLGSLASGLTFGIAAFATLQSRRDARSRRWIDWPMFVALMPFALYSASLGFGIPANFMLTQENLVAGTRALSSRLALVIPLSLLILRWFTPAWNRLLSAGYHGLGPPSSPSEA